MPKTQIAPAPVYVPLAAAVTPSGGQAQALTATNAAGGALLEALCSGGDFPYLSKPGPHTPAWKMYPDSVQLCLAPGETATVQVRLDGGTPATTGPWPNLQVKPTYLELYFGEAPLPTGVIKLIASAATGAVEAIFHWSEGRG